MDKKFMMMDGNEAAAYAAYAFTEMVAIYPISPSSPMAAKTAKWAAEDKKNFFDQVVQFVQMQSEAGAIAAIHGALQTGALSTSFTSSQGLMLMVPVMHRISGERLPCVLHVASRMVGTHGFSVLGDHTDVMNCRQTGFAMLASGSVQETMDLGAIAHLAAIKGRMPVMHFFDGLRTSHELNKIQVIDYQDLKGLLDMDAVQSFRKRALNPEHPHIWGTVQSGDIYFQQREANNRSYDLFPGIVEEYMGQIFELTGRRYHLFEYYGAEDAKRIIVAMGSVSGTIKETVDYLNRNGEKVGFVQVHLFRPFSIRHFTDCIPAAVEAVAVLDRTKESGSAGEPLYQDVCTALKDRRELKRIVGGRYGLSSKDTDPTQIKAVFDNLNAESCKESFTIGITDDVTYHSLKAGPAIHTEEPGTISCKFWGVGADGTVEANTNTASMINHNTNKYAQAYFEFDYKKTKGVTVSHLRFSEKPIHSSYLVKTADFVACHSHTYIEKYDMLSDLKEGGIFLLNCPWDKDRLTEYLPYEFTQQIIKKKIQFYIMNASETAKQFPHGQYEKLILQSAFFSLVGLIPLEQAMEYMKENIRSVYASKGEEIVLNGMKAVEAGTKAPVRAAIELLEGCHAQIPVKAHLNTPTINHLFDTMNKMKGDDLPVSAFLGYEDGRMEVGLSKYEKRNIASKVPKWNQEKCTQCNTCSFVCPHSVIRPYLLNQEEFEKAPKGMQMVKAKGEQAKEFYYTLQISNRDCTGCGNCADNCQEQALTMKSVECKSNSVENWEYCLELSEKEDLFAPYSVKGSQFRQPLLEFSPACAGCGETPYAKLLTQLLGDRVFWANATGCSQAWGAAMPGIPYTVNKKGKGPAWSNCLFESNAEFSLGMILSVRQQREAQRNRIKKLLKSCEDGQIRNALLGWLDTFDSADQSSEASEHLIQIMQESMTRLKGENLDIVQAILQCKDQLSKKSFWMFGGDGWAYDIGYGGLDHVIASGENVNVFIVNNELYGNTGGQSTKATPIGAVTQFCSDGKKTNKKDLGALFMTYGNVYVAQVAMGADREQLLKAIQEAENYNGPSVIIAYAPCIHHGMQNGMSRVQNEMKRAVDSGFWNLYRYHPEKEHPFKLDSKEIKLPFEEFLEGESRFAALKSRYPDNAMHLLEKGKSMARQKQKEYNFIENGSFTLHDGSLDVKPEE